MNNYLVSVLQVRDLDASSRFYRDVLGFDVWFTWPADEPRAVGFTFGEGRLIVEKISDLSEEARRNLGAGVELYFVLHDRDLDEYYRRVAAGAHVVEPPELKPWGDRVFAILDPDGYTLRFAVTAS